MIDWSRHPTAAAAIMRDGRLLAVAATRGAARMKAFNESKDGKVLIYWRNGGRPEVVPQKANKP